MSGSPVRRRARRTLPALVRELRRPRRSRRPQRRSGSTSSEGSPTASAEVFLKWDPPGVDLAPERERLEWAATWHSVPEVHRLRRRRTRARPAARHPRAAAAAAPSTSAGSASPAGPPARSARACARCTSSCRSPPVRSSGTRSSRPSCRRRTTWSSATAIRARRTRSSPTTAAGSRTSTSAGSAVGDRWVDLAVGSANLDGNFGPGFQDEYFAAYGIARDEDRIRFYRALWDAARLKMEDMSDDESPPSSSASSRARSRPRSSSRATTSSPSATSRPKAPVHLLIVPKTGEYRDVVELADGDPDLLAEHRRGRARPRRRARRRRVPARLQHRRAGAGQTVFHVHAHVLGGGLEEGIAWRLATPSAPRDRPSDDARPSSQVDGVAMVRLLGPQDRLLTTIEHQYPGCRRCWCAATTSRSRVPAEQVARGDRGSSRNSSSWCATAPTSAPAEVTSSARILERGEGSPAEVLSQAILTARGKSIRPKTLGPEGLRRRDRREHDRVRHRPGRHRQDLPRDGEGRAGAAAQRGRAHHPDAARRSRRGSGSASCPAR